MLVLESYDDETAITTKKRNGRENKGSSKKDIITAGIRNFHIIKMMKR